MQVTDRATESHGAHGRIRRLMIGFAVALAAAAAVATAGCGSDSSTSSTDGAQRPAMSSAEVPEVTWGINVKDLTLNTLFPLSGVPGIALSANVGEGLLRYNADGTLGTNLASSWKQVSPTVYTYTLKRGLRFSNGKPVTMDDVLYSLRTELDPRNFSATFMTSVKSFTAKGDTLTVTLKKFDPTWRYIPGHYSGWIYEKASMIRAGSKFGSPQGIPVGSGPYKITEFTSDHVTFVRNPYYHGPRPKVGKVVVRLITDDATRLAAMQSGDLDGTLFVPVANLPQWSKLSTVNIVSVPSPNGVAGTFNVTKPPFDDVHVRRAVMYAFNREAIVRNVLHGRAVNALSLIPPELWVNEVSAAEAKARTAEQGPQYPFDMAKAKAELAQSRYPDGFTTTVSYPPDDAAVGLAMQVWAQDLKSLGITLKLNEESAATLFPKVAKGDFNLVVNQGSFDYPDPLGMLPGLCACNRATGLNSSGYNNPQFDRLFQFALAEPDRTKRVNALMQAVAIASRDIPFVSLWWENAVAAVNKKYALTNFGGWTWLRPWMSELGAAASPQQ